MRSGRAIFPGVPVMSADSDSLPAKPIFQSGSPSPLLGERGLGGEGMSAGIKPATRHPEDPSPPGPLSPKRGEGEKRWKTRPLCPKRGEGEIPEAGQGEKN